MHLKFQTNILFIRSLSFFLYLLRCRKNGTTGVLGSLKTAKNILDNYEKNPQKVTESEIKKGIDLLEKASEAKGYMKGRAKIYAGASMDVDMIDTKMPKITGFNKIKQEAKNVFDKLVNSVKGKKYKVKALLSYAKKFAGDQQTKLDKLYKDCIPTEVKGNRLDLAKNMVSTLFNIYVFNNYDVPKLPPPKSKRLPSAGGDYYLSYDEMFSGGGGEMASAGAIVFGRSLLMGLEGIIWFILAIVCMALYILYPIGKIFHECILTPFTENVMSDNYWEIKSNQEEFSDAWKEKKEEWADRREERKRRKIYDSDDDYDSDDYD